MISSETEYREALKRLSEEQGRLADHRARLKETGLTEQEIKRVVDPMESFYLQFKEEVESYERLKRGEFKS
jgi:predicted DNA-binding protein